MVRNIDFVFGYPSLVRFSWKPASKALSQGAVSVKWCRHGDDDDDEPTNQSRLNFSFASAPSRYRYFVDSDMEIVVDF